MTTRTNTLARWRERMRPQAAWTAAALIGLLVASSLSSVFASTGDTAAEAIPVGNGGRFASTTAPNKSTWFRFSYEGGDTITISVTYEPADSNLVDFQLFTGSPDALREEGSTPGRVGNTLTQTWSDPSRRDVFIEVKNGHPDRTVSYVGSVTPTGAIAAPPAGTATPTPGPVAESFASALLVNADGTYAGTVAAHRATFYRFYYTNPGADATISVSVAPDADGATLKAYLNCDAASELRGNAVRIGSENTLTRQVNAPTAMFVCFVLSNNGSETVAYAGKVTPVGTPPVTPTATATAAAVATPAPTANVTAPSVLHDSRYFQETGYRVDNDAVWGYFDSRGRVTTFGFPVSRTFTFLGCPVQVFQRLIIQICGAQSPALINLLDPEIFPYTRVNGSVFPAPDDGIKASTPRVSDPNYGSAILDFIQANVPNTFEGQPVNFYETFVERGGLEVWGAVISRPARDPGNSNFVYQRFQRGIMHYRAGLGTESILLADYLKAILRDRDIPTDLRAQAQGSRYFAQYCPGGQGWLCRPADLPGTDLTFAFEQG